MKKCENSSFKLPHTVQNVMEKNPPTQKRHNDNLCGNLSMDSTPIIMDDRSTQQQHKQVEKVENSLTDAVRSKHMTIYTRRVTEDFILSYNNVSYKER